jgi:hypothetical protein
MFTAVSGDGDMHAKMQLLVELVRHNPAVRSCIQRVYNEIVPTAVQVKESGKDLAPALQRFLGPWLAQFLEHALEMAYMCGFVVFVRRRHEGVEVPVLLPLGSFTWGVDVVTQRTKKRKRELACLYRYSVRPIHPEVTPEDIFVFNFQDPVVTGNILPSPLDGLLAVVRIVNNMERRLEYVVEWNSMKHILTSERVDNLKDQTIEGISLLDSFRRYLHTGEHDGINRFYLTRNGDSGVNAKNPTDIGRANINHSFNSRPIGFLRGNVANRGIVLVLWAKNSRLKRKVARGTHRGFLSVYNITLPAPCHHYNTILSARVIIILGAVVIVLYQVLDS